MIKISYIIGVVLISISLLVWCCLFIAQGENFVAAVKYNIFKIHINQKHAKSHLRHVHAVLDKCNIDFFLTEGTALGAIREKRVIPHDNDIDIGVDMKFYNDFRNCALPAFKRNGFKTIRDKAGEHYPYMISIIKDYLSIDFMFMGRTWDCMNVTCKKMREYLQTKIKVRMYGLEFDCLPIPYLEQVYGDWKTPKREKPSTNT